MVSSFTSHAQFGILDNTFNTNGKVITDISNTADQSNALAIQNDGKIIIAGKTFTANVNSFEMYANAKPISGARKNTHPTATNIKVIRILIGVPILLVSFIKINLSKINRKPWYAPQRTKVQEAPCHKPETKNTIQRFKSKRDFETLFPPSGMYK